MRRSGSALGRDFTKFCKTCQVIPKLASHIALANILSSHQSYYMWSNSQHEASPSKARNPCRNSDHNSAGFPAVFGTTNGPSMYSILRRKLLEVVGRGKNELETHKVTKKKKVSLNDQRTACYGFLHQLEA